ncbi:MAG: multidrug efflux SMR transporter [Pseudomonadota bacterium]
MHWVYLVIAITAEVVGTTALKASDGFTNYFYGIFALTSYGVAFYFLAVVLQTIPVGVAYAIWAGAGVAAVTLIGFVVFGQKLDMAALVGISLIVAGVIVLNTLSTSVDH